MNCLPTPCESARRPDAPAHDDVLRDLLRERGWVSDRYAHPELSDEFEWPASIPDHPVHPGHLSASTGTVIYLEPGIYWAFAPQDDGEWRPPEMVYRGRRQLLDDLDRIESWRCPCFDTSDARP